MKTTKAIFPFLLSARKWHFLADIVIAQPSYQHWEVLLKLSLTLAALELRSCKSRESVAVYSGVKLTDNQHLCATAWSWRWEDNVTVRWEETSLLCVELLWWVCNCSPCIYCLQHMSWWFCKLTCFFMPNCKSYYSRFIDAQNFLAQTIFVYL